MTLFQNINIKDLALSLVDTDASIINTITLSMTIKGKGKFNKIFNSLDKYNKEDIELAQTKIGMTQYCRH